MNATLTALAEPNRLRIVELLRDKPRPVGEIAKRLRLRQPQVSKHLRVLSDAGVKRTTPASVCGCIQATRVARSSARRS